MNTIVLCCRMKLYVRTMAGKNEVTNAFYMSGELWKIYFICGGLFFALCFLM